MRDALPLAIAEAQGHLAPGTNGDFKRHLVPALTLVAPAGFSEQDSVAWQAAAKEELRGIPADLLAIGAAAARKVADHPSKIIVAIHKAIGSQWADRKAALARLRSIDDAAAGRRQRMPWEPEPFDPATACDPAEAARILAEAGVVLTTEKPRAVGPLRMPTEADYAAMGITPERLAASRAKEAEERAAAMAAQPAAPVVAEGPAISADGLCPHCGSSAEWLSEADGVVTCNHPDGCGKTWRPMALAA